MKTLSSAVLTAILVGSPFIAPLASAANRGVSQISCETSEPTSNGINAICSARQGLNPDAVRYALIGAMSAKCNPRNYLLTSEAQVRGYLGNMEATARFVCQ